MFYNTSMESICNFAAEKRKKLDKVDTAYDVYQNLVVLTIL